MKPILYIMQGPSGSGKSTLAQKLADIDGKTAICSTDSFFIKDDGTYEFVREKLPEAHLWNLMVACDYMMCGYNVVVDNTNIRRWECKPYVEYALSLGFLIVFVRVDGRFQNAHGVPNDVVERMRNSMEELTVESVMASKPPSEKINTNLYKEINMKWDIENLTTIHGFECPKGIKPKTKKILGKLKCKKYIVFHHDDGEDMLVRMELEEIANVIGLMVAKSERYCLVVINE